MLLTYAAFLVTETAQRAHNINRHVAYTAIITICVRADMGLRIVRQRLMHVVTENIGCLSAVSVDGASLVNSLIALLGYIAARASHV